MILLPTMVMPISTPSLTPSVSANKGKKRARFVDENEDDRRDQIHRHQAQLECEPPPKKLCPADNALDHLDTSDNGG